MYKEQCNECKYWDFVEEDEEGFALCLNKESSFNKILVHWQDTCPFFVPDED